MQQSNRLLFCLLLLVLPALVAAFPVPPVPQQGAVPTQQTITLNGVLNFVIERPTPQAGSATVIWSLSSRAAQKPQPFKKVAKQFIVYHPDRSIAEEQLRLFNAAARSNQENLDETAFNGGESQINHFGDRYGWLVMPANVHELTALKWWHHEFERGGRRGCLNLLKTQIRPEFKHFFRKYHSATQTIPADPALSNTMWDPRTKSIIGLVNAAQSDITEAAKLLERHSNNKGPEVGVANLATDLAQVLYPDSLCPPSTNPSGAQTKRKALAGTQK